MEYEIPLIAILFVGVVIWGCIGIICGTIYSIFKMKYGKGDDDA
jgi:hypothetical protein